MDRKKIIASLGLTGLASTLGLKTTVRERKPNPLCRPEIGHRLYQGSFPVESVPGWNVVMTTSPSDRILDNFGMGLVTYVFDEARPPKVKQESQAEYIEKLAKISLGQKLYLRVNWKDLQKEPGKLSLSDAWQTVFEMAEKYNKRIGFRVIVSNLEISGLAILEFVTKKVPKVKLGKTKEIEMPGKVHYELRYDDPAFQRAFREFDELLALKYNGNPYIEYMDTYMYGFWGEGHTWPLEGNPFPDSIIATDTFTQMFALQRKYWWDKVPLATNMQPDFSDVGNDVILRKTLATNNWLRSDTIFIENQQIAALSNRAPWIAATLEVGMSDGTEKGLKTNSGQTLTDNENHHVMDLGANYYSLWNWQAISVDKVLRYYKKYPVAINKIAKNIGYRIGPSWIWYFEKEGHPSLIFGLVNDGITGVPGAIKLSLKTDRGKAIESGYIDPGYPQPTGVRQVQMMLHIDTDWRGLRLYAELQVKNRLYPVEWASHEKLNSDGSLTLISDSYY